MTNDRLTTTRLLVNIAIRNGGLDFMDIIILCAERVKNESWEIRKAVFHDLYLINADIYFWEENAMYRDFCNTNEERYELREIVYGCDDY